ncbi:hypothetical protein [Streptococcus massiliensis]|uniref:Uncharacterized protein n=1 Tax=Streptococcus massiliensis TaxID=313439 RepID=A0A380KY07_9STRE|nr:hypothetical protein [Streptococcus massiliensis]SUN76007.1 Uncharacterised protein [Streptococcus massiliensis]
MKKLLSFIFLTFLFFFSGTSTVYADVKVSAFDQTKLESEYTAWRKAMENYIANGKKYINKEEMDLIDSWKWRYGYGDYDPQYVNLDAVSVDNFVGKTNVWATINSKQKTIIFDGDSTTYHYKKTASGYQLDKNYNAISAQTLNTLIDEGIHKDTANRTELRNKRIKFFFISSPIWLIFLLAAYLSYYKPELIFRGQYGLWIKNARPTKFYIISSKISAIFSFAFPIVFFIWLAFFYQG